MLVGTAVGAAAILMYASPASAAPVALPQVQCSALLNGATIPVKVDFTFEALAPATAAPGVPILVTIPARTSTLPATSSGFTVLQYSNVAVTYGVTGGTIQNVVGGGDPTINGTPTPGTATATADTLILGAPGPIPPGALASPAVTFEVVGAAAGTTVNVVARQSTTTAALEDVGDAAVTCPLGGAVLTSTQVVAAGAPTANDDTASTEPATAVTIDVLVNDTPDATLAINPASLAITTAPTKGTATVTDGKVVYTPSAGTQGTTDELVYTVCSIDDADPATTPPCDTATATITIAAAAAAAAAAAPPTAAAALPRTGATTAQLALFGAAMVATGAVTTFLGRSRRRVRA